MTRFIMEICYGAPLCYEDDNRPTILSKVQGLIYDVYFLKHLSIFLFQVHYLHFGILLFGIVCIVNLSISFLTPPIDEKHVNCQTMNFS